MMSFLFCFILFSCSCLHFEFSGYFRSRNYPIMPVGLQHHNHLCLLTLIIDDGKLNLSYIMFSLWLNLDLDISLFLSSHI